MSVMPRNGIVYVFEGRYARYPGAVILVARRFRLCGGEFVEHVGHGLKARATRFCSMG